MAADWAGVCVKLLQGPIYQNDANAETWQNLVRWQSEVAKYFSQIGISVFVDVGEGFAFLEQKDEEEGLRLIRRHPLSFEMSLLCVLLREELERFDVSQNDSSILVMSETEIRDLLVIYFKEKADQTKLYRDLAKYLNQAADLTFLKEINPASQENAAQNLAAPLDRQFEVRRILRAKIDVDFLSEFKKRLEEYSSDAI